MTPQLLSMFGDESPELMGIWPFVAAIAGTLIQRGIGEVNYRLKRWGKKAAPQAPASPAQNLLSQGTQQVNSLADEVRKQLAANQQNQNAVIQNARSSQRKQASVNSAKNDTMTNVLKYAPLAVGGVVVLSAVSRMRKTK